MNTNLNFNESKKNCNDEFYTRIEDVQAELDHYAPSLKGARVYCNADSSNSAFTRYLSHNFHQIGLERLDATSMTPGGRGTHITIDARGTRVRKLEGDGDFRSDECVKLAHDADILITNPPFSLFRDYATLLDDLNTDFLVIGNLNAVSYAEFYPLLLSGRAHLGITRPTIFNTPDGQTAHLSTLTRWFTTLKHGHGAPPMTLTCRYTPDKYPRYDHYDAIEVGRVTRIPAGYAGAMGVPITFLDKHNPAQFDLLDARVLGMGERQRTKKTMLIKDEDTSVGGTYHYARVAIRRTGKMPVSAAKD